MEQLTEQQLQNCNNAGLGVALRMAMHQPVLAVGGEGRTIMAAAAKRLMELGDIRVMNMLDTDTGLFERALRMFPGENQAYEAMHDAQTEASVYKRQLETAQANYDSLNADLRAKDDRISSMIADYEALDHRRDELQAQVDRLNTSLAQTEAELFREKRDTERLKSALTEANAEVADSDRALKLARADLKAARDAVPGASNAEVWFWDTVGENYIDSLGENMTVVIPAWALKQLVAPYKREPDGIRIVRAEDYRGEDGSIQARYDVFDGQNGGSYQAITVWQRSAKQDEDRPHFAAVERRLLANAPAEPEVKPKRTDAEIVADVTEICRGIAREWKGGGLPSIGDNAEAFRNGPQPAQNIWRIACMIHKGKTGEDGEAAAVREADEIPF